MSKPIAFVSKWDKAKEKEWLHILASAMPEETIIAVGDMSAAQKEQAEFAIVANPDPKDVAVLPHLKWMHSMFAGVDRLVAELGEKAAPIVRLVDPEQKRIMAEAVLAWVYYLQREMPAYRRQQQEKRWHQIHYRAPSSLHVGIIGLGNLGRAAAANLRQGGFNVLGWDKIPQNPEGITAYSGEDGLETFLHNSDIVVLLVPLTKETHDLMNEKRFAAMKKGAALINFARGPIVKVDAILAALESGHLSHAVLDVFVNEPLSQDSPFWTHPRVTVLPHISAATPVESAAKIVAKNLAAWRKSGIMPETVNIKRGF